MKMLISFSLLSTVQSKNKRLGSMVLGILTIFIYD